MKTALCISGLVRCFEDVFSSMEKHLTSIHHPDIFIHTWDKDGGRPVNANKIINLYKPKSIIMESPKQFAFSEMIKRNNIDDRPLNNMYSMFYSIRECNKIKHTYEKDNDFIYDCVIRFRFDIKLNDNLVIDVNKLNAVTFPRYGDYMGLNDQFAWSSSQNMNIYSNLFDHLEEYDIYVRPEFFMKHHIKINNLTVNRIYIPYVLDKCGTVLDNEKIDPGEQLE